MNQASNESIETLGNIGSASDNSQTGAGGGVGASSENSKSNDHSSDKQWNNNNNHQVSGHHDPKQRTIYLALFCLSASSAIVGFILILVWMFNFRAITGIGISNAGQLSNLHPVLMYLFMVSVNMYAVLIYRTHYDQRKDSLKWAHAILSGGNIVMSLLGVIAMIKAHNMAQIPNFYSLHSWIGLITNVFYIMQFISGFVAFMKPGLAQNRRTSLMPWHRFAGTATLVLAATAAITGITELVIFQDKEGVYSKFTHITFIANFAGICVVLMTALSVYLLTAQQYLRPRLNEEEPLKR